jgi:hypothetical protein
MIMRKRIVSIFTLLVIASMLFTACNLPGTANQMEQDQIDLAVTMTLQMLELQQLQTQLAQPEEAPTTTPEPPVEDDIAVEETPIEEDTPTPTDTPEPAIVHTMQPGNFPAGRESGVTDADSSAGAAQGRALAGEDFSRNLFERPFTSEDMVYRPDLDIIQTTLNRASDFVYVEIEVQGQHPDGGLQGTYGFELDLDLDGRGDVLVLASDLQSDWSTDGVFAWKDTNNDVGGEIPMISDGVKGNGYDLLVFEEGKGNDPDLVWARVSPSNPKAAQLAFKPSLIDRADEYLWWVVTDNMVKNPAWYDYNDHFTHDEAGSPLNSLGQYPLKQLAELDNTCRWAVGFVPDGTEPGLCPIAVDPTPEPEPEAVNGAIAGMVWIENNGNNVYNNPPDTPADGKLVYIYQGVCSGTRMNTTTNSSGNYGFNDLMAGQYCVVVEDMGCNYQTPAQTVTVNAGATTIVNFYCEPVP